MKYFLIDLYTGSSQALSVKEMKKWTKGMTYKLGSCDVWQGEEHMVIGVTC